MKTYDERTEKVYEKMSALKKQQKKRKSILTASCLGAVAAVLALVLFLPFNTKAPNVERYKGSDYYDVICKLNEATFVKPRYKNNFEKLVSGFFKSISNTDGILLGGAMNGTAFAPEADIFNDEQYVEVTDNQVQGVIEDDLFKRSDRYLYYLHGAYLLIYEIAQEDTQIVAAVCVEDLMYPQRAAEGGYSMYYTPKGIYLSADCAAVTVLMSGTSPDIGTCTLVVNLDVTDPKNVTIRDTVYLTGSYTSSRMVDGKLLLMNEFVVKSGCDFSDEASFLPQIGVPGNMVSVAAEDIVAPETLSHTRYCVVCKLDGDTLEVQGSAAVLSYSDTIYVSEDTVYVTRGYEDKALEGESYIYSTKTDIAAIYYGGEGLQVLGGITLDGYVKDQYSLDQYDGILRVVTTASATSTYNTVTGEYTTNWPGTQYVNLFCVELSTWQVAASVVDFAPAGEEATSVRFDGPNAYVCTAQIITMTDPVFFFDLSDISNITYTDTGTIDGYSSSLIQLGDGYLLGIGFGDSRQLKVEVYEQSGDGVVSVCSYERDASFPEEYKSYFIDRQNDLVGLMMYSYDNGYQYVVLRFDGYELSECAVAEMDAVSDMTRTRATVIDGCLYVLFSPSSADLRQTDACLRTIKFG